MPRTGPIPPEKRAAILEEIKTSGKSRNQIARDQGVSMSSVTKIAQDNGLGDAFDRSRTEAATRAKVIDGRGLREQLKNDLLQDAQLIRARAWQEYQVVVSTPKGAEIKTLTLPPLGDVRNAYTAVAIAIDKALRLEQYDAAGDNGASAVDEWLRSLVGESR